MAFNPDRLKTVDSMSNLFEMVQELSSGNLNPDKVLAASYNALNRNTEIVAKAQLANQQYEDARSDTLRQQDRQDRTLKLQEDLSLINATSEVNNNTSLSNPMISYSNLSLATDIGNSIRNQYQSVYLQEQEISKNTNALMQEYSVINPDDYEARTKKLADINSLKTSFKKGSNKFNEIQDFSDKETAKLYEERVLDVFTSPEAQSLLSNYYGVPVSNIPNIMKRLQQAPTAEMKQKIWTESVGQGQNLQKLTSDTRTTILNNAGNILEKLARLDDLAEDINNPQLQANVSMYTQLMLGVVNTQMLGQPLVTTNYDNIVNQLSDNIIKGKIIKYPNPSTGITEDRVLYQDAEDNVWKTAAIQNGVLGQIQQAPSTFIEDYNTYTNSYLIK